ncbi:prepilin-type N-terminal cleavage/methylation domain-containing protein [Rickettsiales bacterium]|nr:prepilin-type N-terminal cleavage/methylation domain-containing protein [Rickettsiales bacterium]
MKNKGFTLVELAIVIIILALIAAGIVAAQNMVKQSKLRSLVTQLNEYDSAINIFKENYDAIPGDMYDAYTYFGNACDGTSSNCNGDGSGIIEWVATSGQESNLEDLRAWQHLKLAELVRDNFTGTHQSSNFIGYTLPATKMSGGCISYLRTGHSSSIHDYGRFKNFKNGFYIGKPSTSATLVGRICGLPLFKPKEAYTIDLKMDDGYPYTGRMNIRASESDGCVGANSAADQAAATSGSEYKISGDIVACNLIYQTE